jgi:hypothetical protein
VSTQRMENPHDFAGGLTASGGMTIPAGAVSNAQVAAGAAIAHDKLDHQYGPLAPLTPGTAQSETVPTFVARSAGTVLSFKVGAVVANIGAATVTFDLKKNGTTVLTGVVTLNNGDAAYTPKAGTLSGTPTFVAGDVFTVVTVATAGGGTLATGIYATMRVSEGA